MVSNDYAPIFNPLNTRATGHLWLLLVLNVEAEPPLIPKP